MNKKIKKKTGKLLGSLVAICFLTVLVIYGIFDLNASGSPNVIDGCALPVTTDYSQGFKAEDFILTGIDLVDGDMVLNTGRGRLDPNNIILPVAQKVAVTFLYDGAGFKKSDFGWMYATDTNTGTVDGTPDMNKVRWIYEDMNDKNYGYFHGNGVLDDREYDVNGDGVKNTKDNRVILTDVVKDKDGNIVYENGKPKYEEVVFPAGTELVFVLDSSDNGCGSWCGGTFFTKQQWNEPFKRCYKGGQRGLSRIIKLYAENVEGNTNCYTYYQDCSAPGAHCRQQGWLVFDAIDRLHDIYGFNFRAPGPDDPEDLNTTTVNVSYGVPTVHAVLGAPDETPDAWVLAFDDTTMDNPYKLNDFDFNDVVFLIERKTGGIAQLRNEKVITPDQPDGFFTKVRFEAFDNMPCNGDTRITYYISTNFEKDDNGEYVLDDNGNKIPIWIEIKDSDWIEVYDYTDNNGNQASFGPDDPVEDRLMDNWIPGAPQYTYRIAEIDLASQNNIGRDLLWKAELSSEDEDCMPSIMDVQITGTVARHASFTRSEPIVQTNMVYSGSYETPDPADVEWILNPELRGHLKAVRIYDPGNPTGTTAGDNDAIIWDAGVELSKRNISSDPRKILFPDMSVTKYKNERLTPRFGADGNQKIFRGTLKHAPILDRTLVIKATTVKELGGNATKEIKERFNDYYANDVLKPNTTGARGWINRFTGEYEIEFAFPPKVGTHVKASYSTYSINSGGLEEFTVNNAKLDDNILNIKKNDGFDRAELIKWVQGYKKGSANEQKTWLLGPIDHSAPAVMVPPGIPAWYYGKAVPDSMKESFHSEDPDDTNTFRYQNKDRPVVVFVGGRDGMIHAFDGGSFSWEDNVATVDIEEERGYFKWTGNTSDTADYGTGKELWTYIPGNLVPKLKNNYKGKDSQAYVDASPAISDVYIDGSWKTVLLFAQGDGGHVVTCLDVTDPMNPSFMWQFGDPGLFECKSSPAIGMIKGPNDSVVWVACWVSGEANPYDDPSVYMVDISTGQLIDNKKIILDSAGNDGKGGIGSGQPAMVDSDFDGFIDRMYVGTDKGFMYKVNIEDIYTIDETVINANERENGAKIYSSPAVVVDTDGVRIFFGTGGTSKTKTYKFFAYLDTGDAVTLDWYYELPAGHMVYASAFAAAGQLYFGTTTSVSEDPCEGGGRSEGKFYAFEQKFPDDVTIPDPMVTLEEPDTPGYKISPVVYDKHLYIKTTDGKLIIYGGDQYNSEGLRASSTDDPTFTTSQMSWRELY